MTNRQILWGAGVAVVLSAVNSALINELHAGWPWWVAALLVTVAGAWVAGWMTAGTLSADTTPEAKPDHSGKASRVDARGATGVQIGDGNTQNNTFG